ncbi:hypothetical protein [Sphingomonas sp. RB1R13]|jgi:hypothetical protein
MIARRLLADLWLFEIDFRETVREAGSAMAREEVAVWSTTLT